MAEDPVLQSETPSAREETPGRPLVLNLKKRKKKKRRYSRGFEDFGRMERYGARMTQRMARSVEKGMSKYRRESRKSGKKKRDGALRDFLPNAGVAMSRAMREASSVPDDLARAFNTKQGRRLLREQLRMMGRTLRMWRL